MRQLKEQFDLRISLIYFVAGITWILVSDNVAYWLFGADPALLTMISASKGVGFIVATTGLLYFLLRAEHIHRRKIEAALHQELISHKQTLSEREQAGTILLQQTKRLTTLHELDKNILNAQSLETLAQAALDHLSTLLPAQRMSMVLFDFHAKQLEVLAVRSNHQTQIDVGFRGPLTQDWLDQLHQGQPVIFSDLQTLSQPTPRQQQLLAEGIRSMFHAPLIARGHLLGLLSAGFAQPNQVSPEFVAASEEVSTQVAIAIENIQLMQQLREANAQLQTLPRRLVEAQESERSQIARELHDEIGQSLTGLNFTLELIARHERFVGQPDLVKAQQIVSELLQRTRNLSLDLRPTMLDDLGLLPALLWQFQRYQTQIGIVVGFHHMGVEGKRFSPEIEIAAFRVIQESLTNVARHAETMQATVYVLASPETLTIQIEDTGKGFDVQAITATKRTVGLIAMLERIRLLSGEMTIESTPGTGTQISIRLPLRQING